MAKMNWGKDRKRYISELTFLMKTSGVSDRKFIRKMKSDLFSEDECLNYEGLCEKYGTPKTIFESWLEAMNEDVLLKKIDRRIFAKRALITVVLIGIVFVMSNYVLIWKLRYDAGNYEAPVYTESSIEE